MEPLTIFFMVVALIGLGDSIFLYVSHRVKKKPLVCPIGGEHSGCGAVTESKYTTMFGIRNELLGIIYYSIVFLGILATIILVEKASLFKLLLMIATSVGLGMSCVYVSLQAFVIKRWCFWCTISAVMSVLLFVSAVLMMTV